MTEVFNTASDLRERGFHLRDAPLLLINYDPAGDGDDNDAVSMVQREEWRRGEPHDPDLAVEFIFRVSAAYRIPVGLEFPDKLAILLNAARQAARWTNQGRFYSFIIGVEQNGVGYAMASSLRTKTQAPVIGYTTVANATENRFTGKTMSMPRLAALDNLRVLMELHRVKLMADCLGAKDLKSEMNSFVWRGPGRPEAIEGQKDDLVMSLCGAVWIGSKMIPPMVKQVRIDPKKGIKAHNERLRGNVRIQ